MLAVNLSRKDRERIFRQKEIMNAAVKFFAEKGFNSTTLEEIAGSAEFGKGTLYNYFSNKQEIYKAIVFDVIENISAIINNADKNSSSSVEFLERYTKELFEYCLQNQSAFLLFVREIAHLDRDYQNLNYEELVAKYSEVRKVFENRIEKGIKSKELRKINHYSQLGVFYDHMVFPYIHHHIVCKNHQVTPDDQIKFVLSVLFEGILNKTEVKSKKNFTY